MSSSLEREIVEAAIAGAKLDIENRFTYHPPKRGQPEIYSQIRESAKAMALMMHDLCPHSRELATALTKLDEVVFFANAAIARNS